MAYASSQVQTVSAAVDALATAATQAPCGMPIQADCRDLGSSSEDWKHLQTPSRLRLARLQDRTAVQPTMSQSPWESSGAFWAFVGRQRRSWIDLIVAGSDPAHGIAVSSPGGHMGQAAHWQADAGFSERADFRRWEHVRA